MIECRGVFIWRQIAETAMWMFGVVFLAPAFNQNSGLRYAGKQFLIEYLVPQSGVEALDEGILPRRSRFNVVCSDSIFFKSFPQRARNEFRAVVGANELRCSVDSDEAAYFSNDVLGRHRAAHDNR